MNHRDPRLKPDRANPFLGPYKPANRNTWAGVVLAVAIGAVFAWILVMELSK